MAQSPCPDPYDLTEDAVPDPPTGRVNPADGLKEDAVLDPPTVKHLISLDKSNREKKYPREYDFVLFYVDEDAEDAQSFYNEMTGYGLKGCFYDDRSILPSLQYTFEVQQYACECSTYFIVYMSQNLCKVMELFSDGQDQAFKHAKYAALHKSLETGNNQFMPFYPTLKREMKPIPDALGPLTGLKAKGRYYKTDLCSIFGLVSEDDYKTFQVDANHQAQRKKEDRRKRHAEEENKKQVNPNHDAQQRKEECRKGHAKEEKMNRSPSDRALVDGIRSMRVENPEEKRWEQPSNQDVDAYTLPSGNRLTSSGGFLMSSRSKRLYQDIGDLLKRPLLPNNSNSRLLDINMDAHSIWVAVLDSGIFLQHKAFDHNRHTIQVIDLLNDQTDPPARDYHNHGTAVSAIIAGGVYFTDQDVEIRGLAPFVNLIVLKVTDKDGRVQLQRVTEALEYIDRHHNNVEVINMSFGWETKDFRAFTITDQDKFANQLRRTTGNRVVVCAASNDGQLDSETIAYPAQYGNCLCVGSHDIHGEKAGMSGVGQFLDFLAFGQSIPCASSPGPPTAAQMADIVDRTSFNSGTSFAAPYVTGIVAQVLALADFWGNSKTLGYGTTLRQNLAKTSNMKKFLKEISSQRQHSNERGFGLIQLSKLIECTADGFLEMTKFGQ